MPGVRTHLGPRQVEAAIQLARSGPLDDQVGKELVASTFELNMVAEHAGQHEIAPLLHQLTDAVYGDPAVGPIRYNEKITDGEPHTLEGFGNSSIKITALHSSDEQVVADNPDAVVWLRHGPNNTWVMRIGSRDSVVLPDGPTTLGRMQPGQEHDPTRLGSDRRTSRSHLTLEPTASGEGITVTNLSMRGTEFDTLVWPDPSAIKAQNAAKHEMHQRIRLDDARVALDDAPN